MNELKNKKILIVEDEKDFAWILKQAFDGQDLSFLYAQDGQEGLSMAEKEKPDLIIIDIRLPKMDGITMAKKIKEKNLESKIIFLTGLSDPEYISEAIAAVGETDYIIKDSNVFPVVVDKVKNRLGIK